MKLDDKKPHQIIVVRQQYRLLAQHQYMYGMIQTCTDSQVPTMDRNNTTCLDMI